jgi:hypothetical protein
MMTTHSFHRRLKIIPVVALTLLVLLGTFTTSSAYAHELLPKALIEYMEQHPDADQRARIIDAARNPQQATLLDVAWDFFRLGFQHILEGIDHVLFVLSLLLVFRSLKETLKLITFFTVAHSITLLLAGAEILTLPSTIVEPLIAFSIAYVALTSVFLGKRYPFFARRGGKGLSVFLFGLFHGLGFAGLLQDLAIPREHFLNALISFNVGVEAGQMLILAIALPFIVIFRTSRWYPTVIRVLAVLISIVAIYWVFERIAGR